MSYGEYMHSGMCVFADFIKELSLKVSESCFGVLEVEFRRLHVISESIREITSWEHRKLGDLVEIGDIDHRMPDSVTGGIPYLMTGDFIGENDLNFINAKQISEEDYTALSRKIKPERGDILFARYASVGATRYVETTRKFLISYSCAIIKNGSKICSKYLYYFLKAPYAQRQIELEINTGSQANIGIESMKTDIMISMPNSKEQIEIAAFFSNLDNLITLHQRWWEYPQQMCL